MQRGEIYKKVLCELINRLKDANDLDDDDVLDLKDKVDFTVELENRDWFEGIDFGNYQKFVEEIIRTDKDGAEYDIAIPAHVMRSNTILNDTEFMSLAVADSSSEFYLITSAKLRDYIGGSTTSDEDNVILEVLTELWSVIGDDVNEMNNFWSTCDAPEAKCFYVAYKEEIVDEKKLWDSYAFACLSHANSNKFPLPSELEFQADTKLSSTLVYDKDTEYRQYFDLIHVLAESKYCTDILSRFLNIYQVIEDMCYRRQLCKIANEQGLKAGFLRTASKVLGKKEGEENEIKKGFKDLFPNIENEITAGDMTPYEPFIKNTYLMSDQHGVENLAKIFYKLRNSIVHNKHAELHFSFGNISEYKDVIPLIRKYIEVLEPRVVKILNDHDIKIVDYPDQHIRVY